MNDSHPPTSGNAPVTDVRPDVPRKTPDEEPGLLNQPQRIKRWYVMLVIAAAVLMLADFFYTQHFHTEIESGGGVRDFYGLYAFLGLVVLVVGSKVLRAIVMRPEDYYDE